MRKMILVCLMLVATRGRAQQINLQSVDKLAAAASEKTQVDLDQTMLKFASSFLSDKDRDESAARKVTEGLKGIYVRSFEFDRDGAYSPADLQPIRDQLKGPQWKRIVSVNDGRAESTEVWIYREGENAGGIVVIAAESREVTVVNIVGPLRPEDLAQMGGQFGIPKINVDKK